MLVVIVVLLLLLCFNKRETFFQRELNPVFAQERYDNWRSSMKVIERPFPHSDNNYLDYSPPVYKPSSFQAYPQDCPCSQVPQNVISTITGASC